MQDCIFCKIAKGEAPSTKEYEDEWIIAFKNIEPVSDIHILITPKNHISSFMDLESKELWSNMLKVAQKLVRDRNIENAYKLVFNGGKYQAIPHLHWHLLGGEMKDEQDALNKT